MRALIDSDLAVFKSLHFGQGDFLRSVESFDGFLLWVLELFPDCPKLFLSGPNNFRYKIFPEYKANRKDKPKPRYFSDMREYMVNFWGAQVTDGYEADDAIGLNQADDTVIVSGDKDMLQIPGNHFDIKNNQLFTVTEEQAAYHFWKQMLMGDAVDGIRGIPGLGDKKSTKLLDGVSVTKMRDVVTNEYQKAFGDNYFKEFDVTARCLFIKRGDVTKEYYDFY